jgi:pSer/pThr/pTyr-binding forkhead associated (FHA) protein
MPTLDVLESRLQSLLEVHLIKYLPGYKAEDRIFMQLASEMHNNLVIQDGISIAPDVYVILTHPSTLARWQNDPHLVEELASALKNAGEEAGFRFIKQPTVTSAADQQIDLEKTRIIASFSNESISETRGVPTNPGTSSYSASNPADAFLIQDGNKIIPLNLPVINLGRRLDNQIVIDDPRVSRAHAQMRVAKDRYVLFDLNSSGGTYVNGQRITKVVLNPGDVISLSGVALIFSQDPPDAGIVERVITEPFPTKINDQPIASLPGIENNKKEKSNS